MVRGRVSWKQEAKAGMFGNHIKRSCVQELESLRATKGSEKDQVSRG